MATTGDDCIAVGSKDGLIRLYDQFGIRAKTKLPTSGDAVAGLDVSSDGRWILATCDTYILLVDILIETGKHAGKWGFQRSFPMASKPEPKVLKLR